MNFCRYSPNFMLFIYYNSKESLFLLFLRLFASSIEKDLKFHSLFTLFSLLFLCLQVKYNKKLMKVEANIKYVYTGSVMEKTCFKLVDTSKSTILIIICEKRLIWPAFYGKQVESLLRHNDESYWSNFESLSGYKILISHLHILSIWRQYTHYKCSS